ncbi:hypothetical protein BDQ17DRAFT_1350559 [Cyathus striatus]|nr:hypothetical protein BDQ17DRAFT_1350559 [Cyathus striatus]
MNNSQIPSQPRKDSSSTSTASSSSNVKSSSCPTVSSAATNLNHAAKRQRIHTEAPASTSSLYGPNINYPSPHDLPPLEPTDPSNLPLGTPSNFTPFSEPEPGAFYNDPSDLKRIPYIGRTYDQIDYATTSVYYNREDMNDPLGWRENYGDDVHVNNNAYNGEMPPLVKDFTPPKRQ